MEDQYLFFYIEAMVVCSIVFGILLGHDLIRGERDENKVCFDNVLIAHILYFTVDCFQAAIIAGAIRKTPLIAYSINYILLVLLSLIAATWLTFALAIMDVPWRETRKGWLVTHLPTILSAAVTFILLLAAPSLLIDDELNTTTLYTTTLYQVLFLAAPIFYIIFGFVNSMREASKKENVLNRKLFFIIGIYPVTVLLSGVMQMLFLNAPFFCFNSMIMIILFNLLSMEDQISIDPLTKLNNRGQLMRFAMQESSIHKSGLRTFVVMADANDFKKINDTYGHVEGDRALRMIASALKITASELDYPPFIARFGGDEFVMIVYADPDVDSDAILDELMEKVNGILKELCAKNEAQYVVSMTMGCAEVGPDESFQASLVRSDENLYQIKKMAGVGR